MDARPGAGVLPDAAGPLSRAAPGDNWQVTISSQDESTQGGRDGKVRLLATAGGGIDREPVHPTGRRSLACWALCLVSCCATS